MIKIIYKLKGALENKEVHVESDDIASLMKKPFEEYLPEVGTKPEFDYIVYKKL